MKRRLAALLTGALGATAVLAAGCTSPAGAATVPACGWDQQAYTASSGNAYWPEAAAQYWTTKVPAGARITINGTAPAARYWSLTTYSWYGGILSHLLDTQIPTSGGRYTVTVAPAGGQLQTPFLATGYLMLRTYLPAGPVTLPALSVNGTPIPNCADGSLATPTPGAPSTSSTSSGWTSTAATSGSALFVNPDGHYLSATIADPGPGNVLIVHGRMPSIPVPVRYWSLCTYNAATTAVVDCRNDSTVPVDPAGFYTVTIGSPGQRAAVEAAGGTFLQYSSDLTMRNLVGSQQTGDYVPTVTVAPLTSAAVRK